MYPVPSKKGLVSKHTHFSGKFPPLNGSKFPKRENWSGHGAPYRCTLSQFWSLAIYPSEKNLTDIPFRKTEGCITKERTFSQNMMLNELLRFNFLNQGCITKDGTSLAMYPLVGFAFQAQGYVSKGRRFLSDAPFGGFP